MQNTGLDKVLLTTIFPRIRVFSSESVLPISWPILELLESSWKQDCPEKYQNLRYAHDTTLIAESKEELKSLLMKVKEESAGLASCNSWGLGESDMTEPLN